MSSLLFSFATRRPPRAPPRPSSAIILGGMPRQSDNTHILVLIMIMMMIIMIIVMIMIMIMMIIIQIMIIIIMLLMINDINNNDPKHTTLFRGSCGPLGS